MISNCFIFFSLYQGEIIFVLNWECPSATICSLCTRVAYWTIIISLFSKPGNCTDPHIMDSPSMNLTANQSELIKTTSSAAEFWEWVSLYIQDLVFAQRMIIMMTRFKYTLKHIVKFCQQHRNFSFLHSQVTQSRNKQQKHRVRVTARL